MYTKIQECVLVIRKINWTSVFAFHKYPCVITSQILLRKVLDPPKPLFYILLETF